MRKTSVTIIGGGIIGLSIGARLSKQFNGGITVLFKFLGINNHCLQLTK